MKDEETTKKNFLGLLNTTDALVVGGDEEPKIRPLTPYAEAILKGIPFAPDDVPSWQINQFDFGGGRDVSAALQQLKKRGLIVVSPRTTRSGKRWQRPNASGQPRLAQGAKL
jgi:hypothetical protein